MYRIADDAGSLPESPDKTHPEPFKGDSPPGVLRFHMKFLKILLPVSLIAGLTAGVVYLKQQEQGSAVEIEGIAACNGRLEIKRVDVASLYAGRVDTVAVDRGQQVHKGDVLAVLSSSVTEAQVKSVTAQKKKALETISKIDLRLRQADEEIRLAAIELNDAQNLRRDSLISQTELERRMTALSTRKESKEVLLKEKQEALYETGRIDALLEEAKSRNDDMTVRAPFDGVVEYRLAEPGNVVGAGGRVVSMLDPTDVTLDVFLPTSKAARVKVGDEARIAIDGIDTVIPAKVDYVADDAQFTPKYVETREERAKLLFKVTLRIPEEITRTNYRMLKGGMPSVGYVNYAGAPWPDYLSVKNGMTEIKNGRDESAAAAHTFPDTAGTENQ